MKRIAVFGAIILFFLLIVGSVVIDTHDDQTKIISIVLGMHGNSIIEKSVEVRYGHPPNLGHQCGNFTATVRAINGTSLFTFDVWDPRYQFDEYGIRSVLERREQMVDPDLKKPKRDMGETVDIDLPLLIPYNPDIRTVDLVDKCSGSLLISVNVSPAIEKFRNRFPRDPDVMAETRPILQGTAPVPGKQSATPVVGSILAVILAIILIYQIRR